MIIAWIVGGLVSLSVIALFVGLLRMLEPGISLDERLDQELLARGLVGSDHSSGDQAASLLDRVDRMLRNHDFSKKLSRELLQAGIRMTVPEYLLVRAAFVGIAFAAGLLATRQLVGGSLIAIVGLLAPKYYVSWRRMKRQKAFEDQLDDVLTLLVGSLRAGYSLLHALNIIVDEVPPPASEEFRRVIREVGLGLSLPEALDNLVRRVDSKDVDMMVTAINIQQEVGGNLAVILETISETIRERVRIQGEIRVLTTQQKVTGYILAFLPFILGSVLYLLNPEYMGRLFEPGITLVIPVVAAVGVIIGFLIIRRIVDIKV